MITKAGVAIVKQINGVWHALLVQQKASHTWGFPKGSKTSIQENWKKCARRELAEEAGLFIDIPSESKPIQIKDTAIYVFTPLSSQIPLFHLLKTNDTNEISTVSWIPISDPNDTQFHSLVAKLFQKISHHTSISTLSLPPKKSIINVCQRSKWISTGFFQKRRSTKECWR
jgi:ADP-ribose pyrophosphatase YjhB (NUDIX family)